MGYSVKRQTREVVHFKQEGGYELALEAFGKDDLYVWMGLEGQYHNTDEMDFSCMRLTSQDVELLIDSLQTLLKQIK